MAKFVQVGDHPPERVHNRERYQVAFKIGGEYVALGKVYDSLDHAMQRAAASNTVHPERQAKVVYAVEES